MVRGAGCVKATPQYWRGQEPLVKPMLDFPLKTARPVQNPGAAPEVVLRQETGFSLAAILNTLWRRRPLIAATAIPIIALSVLYLIATPAKFTASTTIIIDTKRIQFLANDAMAETGGVDPAALDSQVETIKSEKVGGAVVKKLKLYDDPEFIGSGLSLTQSLISSMGFTVTPRRVPEELRARGAIGNFKNKLKIFRVGRSYVVEISFTSLDREKAAKIANETAEAYINDQLEAKFQATQRASIWMQQRISELREQASQAYRAVQDFKLANNLIIDASTGKLSGERDLDELTAALGRSRSETAQAQAKLERITSVLESEGGAPTGLPDPAVADQLNNPVILKHRQSFLDTQKREAEYAARYGKNHQATVNLRTDMAGYQKAIWEEVRRIAETYKSEVEIARSREQSIEQRVTELFQQSGTNRHAQVQLRELETAATTYRTIYDNFLNRYTQVVQQQSFPATEARVITEATAPFAKSSPKSSFTLFFGVLAGLALGVVAAFIREHLDRVIRTREQLESGIGVNCIGVIPQVGKKAVRPWGMIWPRMNRDDWKRRPEDKRRLGAQRSQEPKTPLILLRDDEPFSPVAEALRGIKVTFDSSRLTGEENRVFGISSALAGEGKTTLAANLAVSIAKTRRKILLIDCDLRNPSLTRALHCEDQLGVIDLLLGQVTLEQAAQTHDQLGCDFLAGPAKRKPIHTAEILSSPIMAALIDEARNKYEYVIVDLPPLLPVVDVRAAAHLLDAFVLVAEWGRATTDQVEKSILSSPALAERLVGVVLNKADLSVMRRFEGYSGQHYGYYGSAYGTPA